MIRRAPTEAQRAAMLRDAERHERVAAALREVAEAGEPSQATLEAAPLLDEWTWDSDHTPVVVGALGAEGRYHRTRAVHFFAPTGDAVLTDSGWYRLGHARETLIREGWQQ